jgi:hypothetical protein
MAKSKKDKLIKQTHVEPSQLDNLTFADGKVQEDADIKRIKELELALGVEKLNPFGTTNLEIFKEKLADMTMIDLQRLCDRIGIFPSGSRQQIKEKLFREFKSHNKGSLSMTIQSPSLVLDPNNPDHKKTLKILGEI